MKKKLIITSSLITILLALFPVSLYAEEVVQDPAPAYTSAQGVLLDSYFYQNYDLLPYIESDRNQYIDSGIKGHNNLKIYCKLSDVGQLETNGSFILFGSRTSSSTGKLYVGVLNGAANEYYTLNYSSDSYNYSSSFDPYVINEILVDQNDIYLNNNLIHTFTESNFNNNLNIYIFGLNNNGVANDYLYSEYKLYSFYIYDYSLDQNNEEIGYVRFYYPAKAKSSGVIGLYDAVSKTFVSTSTAVPFESPTDDQVLHFQISDFITSGLTWIGDILDFVIAEPMLLFFMAVGLAGAMYRWARRLVHF